MVARDAGRIPLGAAEFLEEDRARKATKEYEYVKRGSAINTSPRPSRQRTADAYPPTPNYHGDRQTIAIVVRVSCTNRLWVNSEKRESVLRFKHHFNVSLDQFIATEIK